MADLIDRDAALARIDCCLGNSLGGRKEFDSGLMQARKFVISTPAVTRWISVEYALPEIKEYHISETVLCYCDSGALAIARLEANGFGQVGFNCEKDDEYRHSAGKVLYWMPIPEIPEPPEKE